MKKNSKYIIYYDRIVLLKNDILSSISIQNIFSLLASIMVVYQLSVTFKQLRLDYEKTNISLSSSIISKKEILENKTDNELNFNIFGVASSPGDGIVQNPKKTLHNTSQYIAKMKLSGIVFSPRLEYSIAIIESDNHQYSIGTGEKIPGYDATIIAINNDHVIIDDKEESVVLYLNYDSEKLPLDDKKAISMTHGPRNIYDVVNITPDIVNKNFNGYRLNAGNDKQLFYQVGLHDNDLAIALNGIDLRNARESQEIMKQLSSLTELKITVERNNQLYDIFITVGAGKCVVDC